MKIICISGKAKNGKDCTAQKLYDNLTQRGYKVLITHYADLLKYICEKFFDWNGEKDEHGRTLLQYVGTEIIREQMPDYWVDFVISILKFFHTEWDYVLIPDCRFPNEIEKLKEDGFDTYSIRVKRPDFDNGLTEEQKSHPSETSLDNYEFDCVLENTTLEELDIAVQCVISSILNVKQTSEG